MDANRSARRSVRSLGASILTLLPLLIGCRLPGWTVPTPPAPVVLSAQPTSQEILAAIAGNGNAVRQLQSQVRVSVQDLPSLSGQLAIERPRRLRMQANLLGVGGTAVDVGSNDESFWIVMPSGMPGAAPLFLYARHEEFAATLARQRMPLQPEWISDALGLLTLTPETSVEGPFPRADGNWELRLRAPAPQGVVTRVVMVERGTARVLEQTWYDGNLRPLVTARSSDFEYQPSPGVSLPRKVTLTITPGTADQLTLALQMNGWRINQLMGGEALWIMPESQGAQAVDLGRPGAWMTGREGENTLPTHPVTTGTPAAAFRPQYRGRDFR